MIKKLNWEQVKFLISEELKKSKHILTFGTIGSCNLENDIDIIITKKSSSPSSEFYREIHNLYDFIDNSLKINYSKKLGVFSGGGISPEQLKISTCKKGDVIFDVMTYVSLKELENNWLPYMSKTSNIKEFLKKEYNCILGKIDFLFTEAFVKESRNDYLFLVLMKYDKINSKYPKSFLIDCMNYHFDYILRKRLGLESMKANSIKESRKIFYQICDILDK
jgi:hypothetical protein